MRYAAPFLTAATRQLAALLATSAAVHADVTLAPPFQDHAVLQAGERVPIWGLADPGERVRVTFAGQTPVEAVAGSDGQWRAELPVLSASAVPAELVVEGRNRIVARDVLVGEVWLCSGQSNMDRGLARFSGTAADIAAADFPAIRQLRVARNPAAAPQDTAVAAWSVCSPATAPEISAVGFYFARDLWRARGVPVGLIVSTHGDTPIEAWVSADALAGAPEFGVVAQRWAQAITLPAVKRYQAPSGLYNGMIHPLVPYALRGFLWYQGESNAARAAEYARLFPELIRTWRHAFGQNDAPFFWVQLPNLREREMPPGTTAADWVALRAAQTAALALPATGQAVTIDVGDPDNIHPPRKREVAERLARLARRQVHGEAIQDRGPEPAAVSAEGDTVRVRFDPRGGRPELRGDGAAALELAGGDGVFVPATTVALDRENLVVRAAGITAPVAIRYAWRADPTAVIFNDAGLPAAPFQRPVQ